MCSKAKSPLRTTVRQCVSSLGGAHLRRALSSAAQLILNLSTCKVCVHPSALLCFGVYLTPHLFTGLSTGFAATLHLPSPSTRMVFLFVTPSGKPSGSEALCAVPQKGCMYSIWRVPPYWDITNSPIGRSTALRAVF